MKRSVAVYVLALSVAVAFAPAPAFAQPSTGSADVAIAALRTQWKGATANITAAAEELTDAEYGYRPVAGVRTFGLVAALKASNAYCAKAYAIGTAAASALIDVFGEKNTKVGALALNAVHDGEHYGNIVTYMRMQGKVPPSSKR